MLMPTRLHLKQSPIPRKSFCGNSPFRSRHCFRPSNLTPPFTTTLSVEKVLSTTTRPAPPLPGTLQSSEREKCFMPGLETCCHPAPTEIASANNSASVNTVANTVANTASDRHQVAYSIQKTAISLYSTSLAGKTKMVVGASASRKPPAPAPSASRNASASASASASVNTVANSV